ncbi:MAG TPA: hypothetical protein VJ864_16645 [Candidatus Binatia bacterium]|nr:hypothetical protein [Candidatus Binatia bacterium]
MLRRAIYEHRMVTGGWASIDPVDNAMVEAVYKKNIREGEERLMLAVLESAVEDFQKYVLARRPSGKKLFQQAEEWFLEKDSDELFSFASVCESLGLHPEPIRKGLMVWKEAELKTPWVEAHRHRRAKLRRSRIRYTSARLSKTA